MNQNQKNYVVDPKASLPGRVYSNEKPWSCKYCYWWGGKNKGCMGKQCYYLLPKSQEPKQTSRCECCPYGKQIPCIGYCISDLHSEMKGERK